MKKRIFACMMLLAVFGSRSFAADRLPLIAKLPSVDKLPASCCIVFRNDFQGLERIPFFASPPASVAGSMEATVLQADFFSLVAQPFGRVFAEEMQEFLLFRMDLSDDSTNHVPALAAYVRGTFSRADVLRKLGKSPEKKIGGTDFYRVHFSEQGPDNVSLAFIAENAFLFADSENALKIALGALRGEAPSLAEDSPFVSVFKRNHAPLLCMIDGDWLHAMTRPLDAGADSASKISDIGFINNLGSPPSSYCLSLASLPVATNAVRATLAMDFRSEAEMMRARSGLQGMLDRFTRDSKKIPGIEIFVKRLKISNVYKELRFTLDIDEDLMGFFSTLIRIVPPKSAPKKKDAPAKKTDSANRKPL